MARIGPFLIALVVTAVAFIAIPYQPPVAALPLAKLQDRVPAAVDLGEVKLAALTPPAVSPELYPQPVAVPPVLTRPVFMGMPRARPALPDVSLVSKARKYIGTNPTGWARLWCAKFMAMIAPEVARKVPNPNLARSWAVLPKVKPAPGVIVVLTRGKSKSAGHIGVVAGFDRNGNPRVVSGNHNRRVAESVYSKHRVVAYVSPRG